MSIAEELMLEPLQDRVGFLAEDPSSHRELTRLTGTPWFIWQDSPVEFVEQVLGETTWQGQRDILQSTWDHERTAVVASHGTGKTHIAARIVCWWIATHPLGAAQSVTTAPTWRQVRTLLWPHIRRLHHLHGLPGKIGLAPEWRIGDDWVAIGFSPSDHDEAAAQGIHSPYILVMIDEAGGISATRMTGLEGIMSAGFARMVAIGNAPTDQEDSPFEERYNLPTWNGIQVPAFATPNFTGEETGLCTCVISRFRPHPVAEHLTSREWVDGVRNDFGEDSNYYIARVMARFPKGGSQRVVPWQYVETAINREAPEWFDDQASLGVDIASDGGDELTIASAAGYELTFRAARSGEANADMLDVAGFIKNHITGEDVNWGGLIWQQRQLNPDKRGKVKVDAIGLGWGVVGVLKSWVSEFQWPIDIVPVQVGERCNTAEGQRKFTNKRAEAWWNLRTVLADAAKLHADKRTQAQIAGPRYMTTHAGRTQIESKKDMKLRGLPSPDRAEAIMMAAYPDESAAPVQLAEEIIAQRVLPGVKQRGGVPWSGRGGFPGR